MSRNSVISIVFVACLLVLFVSISAITSDFSGHIHLSLRPSEVNFTLDKASVISQ